MMNYTLKSTTNCATVFFNQNDSQRRIWRHQLPYSHLQDTLQMCKFSAVPGLQHLIWLRLHGGCSLAWVYVFPMWMLTWSEGTCFLFSASVSKGKTTAFYSESHVSCNPCRTVFIQYFFAWYHDTFSKQEVLWNHTSSVEQYLLHYYVLVLHSCMFQALICVLCCVFHALCVLRGWMEAAAREVALDNTICFALLCVCCAVCFAPLCVSQCERLVWSSGCKGSCIT